MKNFVHFFLTARIFYNWISKYFENLIKLKITNQSTQKLLPSRPNSTSLFHYFSKDFLIIKCNHSINTLDALYGLIIRKKKKTSPSQFEFGIEATFWLIWLLIVLTQSVCLKFFERDFQKMSISAEEMATSLVSVV